MSVGGPQAGIDSARCNCVPNYHRNGAVEHAADCPVESSGPIGAESVRRIQDAVEQIETRDIQMAIAQLLEEILAELKHLNSVERTGAVSSVEVKFLAPTKDNPLGRAQPVVKIYAGSEAPVDEAIIAYAKTVVLAERGQMEGWQATVDRLPKDLQGSAEQKAELPKASTAETANNGATGSAISASEPAAGASSGGGAL